MLDTGERVAQGGSGDRLRAHNATERSLQGLAGLALARPWFDRLTLWVLRRAFFPVSRLWAAAEVAGGSPARFWDAVPMRSRPHEEGRLGAALAAVGRARAAVSAVEAEWERVFFGETQSTVAHRVALEAARLDLSHAYNATRRCFWFLLGDRDIPRARHQSVSPDEVAAIYGEAATAGLGRFVAAPEPMPQIAVSRAVPAAVGKDYWVRFKSPSGRLGDVVTARVHEPEGVGDPPTLIFGHGVCVEFDHWRNLIEEANGLVAAGIRVIRPEAPWHGRRRPSGTYGGERAIASFPCGALDALSGAVSEWAVLAEWSRRTSRGALAMGGSSLGALTAQLAAAHARDWPERLRPDALLLITHCGRIDQAIMHGEIARMWGAADDLAAKGWTHALAAPYLRLLDPCGAPVVPPDRIISVLGDRDTVTPFGSGLALVRSWGVPERNVFVWRGGHFTVPMMTVRNKAPLSRFREVIAGIGQTAW